MLQSFFIHLFLNFPFRLQELSRFVLILTHFLSSFARCIIISRHLSRVKCSVCSNSWYQSRDRLLSIPTHTHDLLPATKSELDRIARNLAADVSPDFMGVNKLYVGNLNLDTTEDDLLKFFEGDGGNNEDGGEEIRVCDVSLVTGPEGKSRGFAFVTFYEESGGKAALGLNGKECNGREVSVREPNN